VNDNGVARFFQAVGDSWNLKPADNAMIRGWEDFGKKTYESWKAATSPKTSGKMKLRRDQSSAKLF
jgi:hypothetical protein